MGKLLALNPQNIKFVDCSKPGIQRAFGLFELECSTNSFQVGSLYTLEQPIRDGFTVPNSVYELKGILDTYAGIEINSLIVRKVEGPDVMKYTVSKQDCERFGIPYEPQLEILPQSLPWKKACKEFDPYDFGSLQTSSDNLIYDFIIEIDGIEHEPSIECVYIKELDALIHHPQFYNAFQMTFNIDIRDNEDNHTLWHKGTTIHYPFPRSRMRLMNGSLFIHFICQYGINPTHYQGLSASDLLTFNIDSLYTVSYEQYINHQKQVKEAQKAHLINNNRKMELKMDIANALEMFGLTQPHLRSIY